MTHRARLGWLLAGALAVWVAGAGALDQYGLGQTPEGRWDLIVVAGCRVLPDGTPSPALMGRVDRAVELHSEGRAPVVVFTGGVGDHGSSEAAAAAAYASARGLPAAAIRLEERSTSTEENARFAAEEYPAERVLVVSDSYHVFRAERVFGRYYPEVLGVGSTSPALWRARGSLREVLALSWYALNGRLATPRRRTTAGPPAR